MIEPDDEEDSATVFAENSENFVQAGVVHGDIYYYVDRQDTPENNFRKAIRILDGGMAQSALEEINEVVNRGLFTSEVCFFWHLAFLSGKTLRQISRQDRESTRRYYERLDSDHDDQWQLAVKMLQRVLVAPTDSSDQPLDLTRELSRLGSFQQELILRHLGSMLEGRHENQIWHQVATAAGIDQLNVRRKQRVWKYFQAAPARPRKTVPQETNLPAERWIVFIPVSVLCVAATLYLTALSMIGGAFSSVTSTLIATVGAVLVLRDGVTWSVRERLIYVAEKNIAPDHDVHRTTPQDGFADKVDELFNRYFSKYVPEALDREYWKEMTSGIQRKLREEIVNTYRESRTESDQLLWLVRHHARDTKRQWEQGGPLFDYHEKFRTPVTIMLRAILGAGCAIVGLIWLAVSAATIYPLGGAVVGSALLVCGGWAGLQYRQVTAIRAEIAEDWAAADHRFKSRSAEYNRWQARLSDKPADTEMAAWLHCDKILLQGRAMKHYELARSDVIASAVLESPLRNRNRARTLNGPWRYRKYDLIVFLLTKEGVRQFRERVDFTTGKFTGQQRTNYRFDAVASVEVREPGDGNRAFKLTLISGAAFDIPVTLEVQAYGEKERGDEIAVNYMALQASGLTNTLQILEGVAAEGKFWVEHQESRRGTSTERFGPAA